MTSTERIVAAVAERFGISVEELMGQSRMRRCVVPRQVAMYAVRHSRVNGIQPSYPDVGDMFGRDHTTVINAVRVTALRSRGNPEFAEVVAELIREVA